MPLIVLHNNDSQGSRAPAAFHGAAEVLGVGFAGGRISAESFAAIRVIAARHTGPNIVIWLGHGNEGRRDPLTRGHPMTEGARLIDSDDLIAAFRLLHPSKIYLFTCMGMLWVRREARRFYDAMTFLNPSVTIFGTTVHILGGTLPGVAAALLGGAENPVGAFNRGVLFERHTLYSETFYEWRQRVAPQRSNQGAHEAPF
jgi:hypothetical protein